MKKWNESAAAAEPAMSPDGERLLTLRRSGVEPPSFLDEAICAYARSRREARQRRRRWCWKVAMPVSAAAALAVMSVLIFTPAEKTPERSGGSELAQSWNWAELEMESAMLSAAAEYNNVYLAGM